MVSKTELTKQFQALRQRYAYCRSLTAFVHHHYVVAKSAWWDQYHLYNIDHTKEGPSSREMDFAPYQDTAPDAARPASPQSRSPPPSHSPSPERFSRDSPALPDPNDFGDDRDGPSGRNYNAGSLEAGRSNVNLFETSLIRLDYEAMLAYLLLPPAGSVLLLILEHRNDYVRYVAFKSYEERLVLWPKKNYWKDIIS